jgi:cellulose biosynthesis protein BcsQ
MTPDANIDEIVLKSSVAGLDFLPANRDLGTAETTLGAEIGGQQYLKRALGRLKDRYDVILIDCQPSTHLLHLMKLSFPCNVNTLLYMVSLSSRATLRKLRAS